MSFFSAILSKFLDQYIEKVDKNQVKVSLIKGHAELQNISFTPNLLSSFGIPLTIKDSCIKQVIIDVHSESALFKAINADLYATPEWEALNKVSINSVANLIQSMEDEKKATKADKRKAWGNWFEKAIDNATIDVQNVRLHIEYPNWDGTTSSMTLFFESLRMNTIDSKGKVILLKQKPDVLTKRIILSSFSIASNHNVEPLKSFDQLNDINYNVLNQNSFTLTMVHDRRKDSSFLNSITINFDPILFTLTQEQFFSFQYLFKDISKSQTRRKYESCMRPLSTKMNEKYYIKMWSYLFRCAIKIRRPVEFRPNIALQFLKKRKEYAQSFIKSINKKKYVKKSIKNYGEDLSYLLIQYSAILMRRKERMINLDQKEIDSITSEDLTFFSKDSFSFKTSIQAICLKIPSYLLLSVNNLRGIFEKKRENINLQFEVQNWLVDDLNSNCEVIQVREEKNNFLMFKLESLDDPAFLNVSRFKIDIRNSFVNNMCKFFVNDKISKIPLSLTSESTETLIDTLTKDASLMDNELINNESSTTEDALTVDKTTSSTETDSENDDEEIIDNHKIKSSSINQFLILLNPKTMLKFKIVIEGFTVIYSVDNDENDNAKHTLTSEIKQIILKNYSKKSTDTVLNIKSKMLFGPIKVDDAVISEGLSLKSDTLGIIDKYYFLGNLVTQLDVLNANIEINTKIIDKVSSILSSLVGNSQSGFTKIYSDHKIYANCSNISVIIDTGINTLELSIAGIDMNPIIQFRDIKILDHKDPQICIPSLNFNKWPIIETDLLNINLNFYEFFNLLDEVTVITNQITKLTNVFIPTTSEAELDLKQEKEIVNQDDQIKVIAHKINYKMGDRSNSINLNNVVIELTEDCIINIDSLGFYDSDNKEFLFCDNKINLILNTSQNKNKISLKVPCLRMNFLWEQIKELIAYFQDSRDLLKENFSQSVNKKMELTKQESDEDINNFEMIISVENDNALINIEDTFSLQVNKFKLEFVVSDQSTLNLNLLKIDIDNLLEVNDFNFKVESDFIFDISTSSINANLSQAKACKIFNLQFIPGIVELVKKYKKTNIKNDFNVNINNITFTETSTDLHLVIPIIKFTLNSSYSIGAMHIPSIKIETLVIDNIKLLLLFNSADFNIEDIESLFSFERKKVPEDNFKLTSVFININSIDFDYVHYFVMRVFNSWKSYSKFIIKSDSQKTESKSAEHEIKISGLINQINVKERNLSDTISLLGLSFEQKKELTEFKCKSINCIELIKVREVENNSNFFFIQTTKSNTNMVINPIDIYLNINTMKTLTNINESLASLIKTNFDEKLNQTVDKEEKVVTPKELTETDQNGIVNIDAKGFQIHLPFEDDPLFKKHDLVISFNTHIDILMNSYKSFSLKELKMFFANSEKEMNFLPIFNAGLLFIRIDDNNTNEDYDVATFNIETGNIDINLSILDIFELQMIIDNFRKSFTSLRNPQTCSVPDINPSKKKLVFTALNSKIAMNPINISLCEENRTSLIYNPIFSLNIEAKSSTLNIQNQNQSFSIDLVFSIMHLNLFDGKFEPFMLPTDFFISYSNGDSNTAYFGLSIKTDINFNITPYSFRSIMRFIDKFNNKDQILLLKNESKFNYKPEYWVRNNLNSGILIKYHKQEEYRKAESELFVAPNDFLPMCEFHSDSLITFKYKNIQESFSPKNLQFPIYFKTISVSTISHENYSQSIVFNSPLSIQNKLDCKILIYIKGNHELQKFAEIYPKSKFPLHFEEKQYYAFSTFESMDDLKAKKRFGPKAPYKDGKPKIDINNLPDPFVMSLHKTPKVISIQNLETRKSIDFVIKVNDDVRSNTRVYEIISSIFIKNILPCPIFNQFYNRDNSKINNEVIILQSQEEKQFNLINYDTQSILASLSFNINQFQKPTVLKLDNIDELFACSNFTAIQIKKKFKSNQKEIVIFTPCAIFNNTPETIYFTPSNSSSKTMVNKIQPNNFSFYGLESYSENEKSMKIDISIDNSEKKIKAIDCLRLNSNCTTIYLPRIDNPSLFYPLNCSITLGQYPMNVTHVITFTPYLYVINDLPFDFSLIPITSSKIDSLEANYNNLSNLRVSIEEDSQFLLKDSFNIQKNSGSEVTPVPIRWISKDAMFLFSTSKFINNPIIQLNRITRTIFLVKNRKQVIYIEIDIYEDKSTLYAHFQLPSYPVPLVINNSLNLPIYVYQNIKPCKNKIVIGPNTSSIFAYDEPFVNNKQLYIEIPKKNSKNTKQNGNKPEYIPYLFSMQEQMSPLINEDNNFMISSTVISSNNSKLIHVHYLDDIISYQNSFRGFLSINSLHISLSKDKMYELALFSVNNILAEICQDTMNSYITLSIESIQLDNQSPESKTPVCLVGSGRNLLKVNNMSNDFFKLYSIFPRGVPFFTVINFLSIQIQPLFIVPESNLIANLISFFTSISKNKTTMNNNPIILEPSFNSVIINKTLIAYFELSPINIVINIPNENRTDRDSIANAMRYLNMFSLNRFAISIPKIFVSEFYNNFSYLFELFRDYYGNEIMKQISKNVVVKMVTSSLIRFKKLHFVSLSSINNDKTNKDALIDNRKQIFGYFNQIELNDVARQSTYYFSQAPDVITEILDKKSTPKSLSNIIIYHPSSDKSNQKSNKSNIINKDRMILGIKTDSINNSNTNNVDIVHMFKSNDIKRVKVHSISPIFSSFESQNISKIEDLSLKNKVEDIHLKIQSGILKDKKLQNQTIKFVILSKQKGLVYCITNEYVLVLVMNNNEFQIAQEYKIAKMESVSINDNVAILKPADPKLDQIEIKFNRKEDAQTLVSFVNAQKTVINIFGRPIIP